MGKGMRWEILNKRFDGDSTIQQIKDIYVEANRGKTYRERVFPQLRNYPRYLVDRVRRAFQDSAQKAHLTQLWVPDSTAYKKTGVVATTDGYLKIHSTFEPDEEVYKSRFTNSLFYYQPDFDSEWCRIWRISRGFPDSVPVFLGYADISKIKEYDYSNFPLLGVVCEQTRKRIIGFRALNFLNTTTLNTGHWRVIYRGRDVGACRVEIDSGIIGDVSFINVDPSDLANVEKFHIWSLSTLKIRPVLVLGDDNTKPVAWTKEDIGDFSALFDRLNTEAGFPYTSDQYLNQLKLYLQKNPDSLSFNIVEGFTFLDGQEFSYLGDIYLSFTEVFGYTLEDGTVLYLINFCVDEDLEGRTGSNTINYLYYEDSESIRFLRKGMAWGNIDCAHFGLLDVIDTIDPPNRFFVLKLSGYNRDGFIVFDLNNMAELRDIWGYH